jgi:hypothetical protein
VRRKFDAPLREVSGICLRRGKDCLLSLIAVGDRAAELAWTELPNGDNDWTPEWRTADLAKLPGSELPIENPQLEAVCADGAGRVLLLQESPPRAELIDPEAGRVVATIDLIVEGGDKLAESWAHPHGSRGEGVVLLAGGHLLVAKEKEPTALIEFGPQGAKSQGLAMGGALADGAEWPIEPGKHRFVALAVWSPEKDLKKACTDFSDLEIGPDGRLYLLSDQSESIAQIDELSPGGGKANMTAVWRLKDVKGKPEGLAFAANGCAIVALDKSKSKNNLVLLEPAIAATRVAIRQ